MKAAYCLILLVSSLLAVVSGFSPLDHEIFRLNDEITTIEGSNVTFYDFVGVKPTASQDEINKASRKKSRRLHPDKVRQSYIAARATASRKPKLGKNNRKKPGVTVNKPPSESEIQRAIDGAQKEYSRLSVVTEILKGEGRERYDYFLSHGFPTWRGTGYYYARFRPGLGTVLVGLFVVMGGAAHYGAMYLGWKRQREFVERYIRHARRSAWGDESGIQGIPGVNGNTLDSSSAPAATSSDPSFAQENGAAVLNRRQKRAQEKEAKKDAKKGKPNTDSGTSTPAETEPAAAPAQPQGTRKRVHAENGKTLIVDSVGNVYLEEEDEDGEKGEFLLDPNEIPRPTIKDTVLYRLPIWTYEKARTRIFGERETGQKLGTAPPLENEGEPDSSASASEKTSESKGGKETKSSNGTAAQRHRKR